MPQVFQVAHPPEKPLMIFDGDCNFCRRWIERWRAGTRDRISYIESQDPSVNQRFPELPSDIFARSVQLIETDGKVYAGAEAVVRSMAHAPHGGKSLWAYRSIPGFAAVAERTYGLIASHRSFFSWLTRLLWGQSVTPPVYDRTCWLFLRGLGLIYLIAIVSLWTQIIPLIGEQGITPVSQVMQEAQRQVAAQGIGWERYHVLPTLCWINSSDGFLNLLCAIGTMSAFLLILGLAPVVCLIVLWVIYLTLSTSCGVFLSFQWDTLLLETGFLAILIAPFSWTPSIASGPPRPAIWLLRWLLFRLMLESGCVKLLSGDPSWWKLTALNFHCETQPLPTWIAWYVHQLPAWFHETCVLGMFGIELILPFFIFLPRRFRRLGFFGLVGLQVAILLTGNYCFFNLLTMLLCIPLLDDQSLPHWLPFARKGDSGIEDTTGGESRPRWWPRWILFPLAACILIVSSLQLLTMLRLVQRVPSFVGHFYAWFAPFRSINHYGLFAVMTTERPEIVVEGSNDRRNWVPYEFKYKPGDLGKPPRFVAPHQPRLDWQMWFAALGNYQSNPWLTSFCERLLEGSPEVVGLLAHNPFPKAPPGYVRAVLYNYRFTDYAERRNTGNWWRRERRGLYCPVVTSTERVE